jgi:gas vesicle protein
MAKTKDKVTDAAGTVKPYVERALRDEELRENMRNAYQSARTVYDELVARRGVTGVATRVATDKDIQSELRNAIEELRNAAERVQGTKRRQQVEEHGGRNATLLLAGIALGILFNPMTGPETRRWLKDKIFGEDEEFGYGSSGNGG